jgi:hypothetical protein
MGSWISPFQRALSIWGIAPFENNPHIIFRNGKKKEGCKMIPLLVTDDLCFIV